MFYDHLMGSAVQNMANSIPVQQMANSLSQLSNKPPSLVGQSNYGSLAPSTMSPLQAQQSSFLQFLNPNNMGTAGLPGLGFSQPRFGGYGNAPLFQGIESLPTGPQPSQTPINPTTSGAPPATPPTSSSPGTPPGAPAPVPGPTPTPVPTATPAATQASSNVVQTASRALGTPYVWGGTGPDGYDCSGLVQWAYAQNGVNLPRTAQQQYNATQRLAQSDLKPGDLVFFANTYASSEPITHVGIYMGNNQMINAPTEGKPVQVISMSNPFWASHYAGAGRVQ